MKCSSSTVFAPILALWCGIGLGATSAGADDPFAKAKIVVSPVRGPVHMLRGVGGNIGVSAGPDGVLMIDDQFAPLSGKIETAIVGLGHGPAHWVINTHWHGDHTGGNVHFGKTAHIVAHTNVRKRLSKDQISFFGRAKKATPKVGLPVVTYDQGLSLHLNGEEIRVIHMPEGHTDGDSVVWFVTSDVWHLGDHFFNGTFPFVDLRHGGDVPGFAKNLRALLARISANAKIIPGHGPLATRADLARSVDMLTETIANVRASIAAGKTLAQAKAAGLPAKWDAWGKGFIKTEMWIELIYRSLKKMGPPPVKGAH